MAFTAFPDCNEHTCIGKIKIYKKAIGIKQTATFIIESNIQKGIKRRDKTTVIPCGQDYKLWYQE